MSVQRQRRIEALTALDIDDLKKQVRLRWLGWELTDLEQLYQLAGSNRYRWEVRLERNINTGKERA